jgi:asparagine synthetase B (glutamine-hydrolysing)
MTADWSYERRYAVAAADDIVELAQEIRDYAKDAGDNAISREAADIVLWARTLPRRMPKDRWVVKPRVCPECVHCPDHENGVRA